MDCYHKSLYTLIKLQQEGGYFLSASDTRDKSCDIRESSFASHGLDLAGETERSKLFFEWGLDVLRNYSMDMQLTINKIDMGVRIKEMDYIPCKFDKSGEADMLGNPQIDGWAAFLWTLTKHCEIKKNWSLIKENSFILGLLCKYLGALWDKCCCNCWEQDEDKLHISNVIAVYGALKAVKPLLKSEKFKELGSIKDYLDTHGINHGCLVRWRGSNATEAALLWAVYPYSVFEDYELSNSILSKIDDELNKEGMIRFHGDDYYGGWPWPLLNCYLGLGYMAAGNKSKARYQYEVVNKLLEDGCLVQVKAPTGHGPIYEKWVASFGMPSREYLWTAAMYVILSWHMGKEGLIGP